MTAFGGCKLKTILVAQMTRNARRALAALVVIAGLAALAPPAAALDLTQLKGLVGGDWQVKSATPDLVRFICATPSCPPSGELAIAIRPAPDEARDQVVADPQGTLAGYEKGFRNNPANKACEFSDFKASAAGETGSRVEMRGECPSGLVLMMATLFDKRQPGTISVVASSIDPAKAGALRAQAVKAIGAALEGAR